MNTPSPRAEICREAYASADACRTPRSAPPCSAASAVRERIVRFQVGEQALTGIVSAPDGATARPLGVLLVVGGPQYRAGSHRLFVLLARQLAATGYPVLRFDVRGMGDCEGALRDFQNIGDDIAAATEALQAACPDARSVVLWGLCDGASACLLQMRSHKRMHIAGLCLANPWVRTENSLARTQIKHYYGSRLADPGFWRRLLTGRIGLSSLTGFARSLARAGASDAAPTGSYVDAMREGLAAVTTPVLFVLSGRDLTAKEFIDLCAADAGWSALVHRPPNPTVHIEQADHTFSTSASLKALVDATVAFLSSLPTPEAKKVPS